MLVKNNGFFLLELLLSLSVWFMIGLFFVPLLMDLTNQSKELELDKKAKQLLFEELHAKLIDESINSSYSIFDNGHEYKIYWNEIAGQTEVCVTIEENISLPEKKICIQPE